MKNLTRYILTICVALLMSGGVSHAKEEGFNHTGLTLPRFVSLVSDEVNIRTGPGLKYPIHWVFVREGLPVEIIREFDAWREIRDIEGDGGWVHKSLLSGKRTVLAKGQIRTLFRKADKEARPVVQLEPNVIANVKECNEGWCYLSIAGYDGWVVKSHIWGVYEQEELD